MNVKKLSSSPALINQMIISELVAKLNDIEILIRKLTAKINKFPFTHSSYFFNIISDIDIQRETLFAEFFSQQKQDCFSQSYLEEIGAQSSDMINRVENVERKFWENFKQITSSLIVFNIEDEKKKINDFNSKTQEPFMADDLKQIYDKNFRDLQMKLKNFKLFKYNLYQNRFSTSSLSAKSKSYTLGNLYLSTKFIQTLDQEILNVIVAHWNRNELEIWNLNASSLIKRFSKVSNREKCLILDEKQERCISGSVDHLIRIYDLKINCCIHKLDGHSSDVNCLKLLNDGRLASGSNDNTIKIWNITTRQPECEFTLDDRGSGYIFCLEQLKDTNKEHFLLSGSFDRKIRAWDLTKRMVMRIFEGHTDWITAIRIIPNGSMPGQFVSGSYDKTIKIWNINSSCCSKTFLGHTDYVVDLEVISKNNSPTIIISCSYDKTIRCWYDNEIVRIFDELTPNLTCLKSTPNGEHILSGDKDGNIKLWDVSTGKCVNVTSTEAYVTRLELCLIK